MTIKTSYIFLLITLMALSNGCIKKSVFVENQKPKETVYAYAKDELKKEKQDLGNKEQKKLTKKERQRYEELNKSELDFLVENKTGGTIYATCFSYIQKEPFTRWRWDKSPVYKIETGQTTLVNVDTIPDQIVRENVYGYLAIFASQKEAEEVIFELLDERNRISLDKIYKLKNKKLTIDVEKYGFKGYTLDYSIEPTNPADKLKLKTTELDFAVQNNTGKTIWLTCFVYQKKDDAPNWTYDKTPIKKLGSGQMAIVDIDTITKKDVRMNMYGYLAIFDEQEEKDAQDSIYELLDPYKKIYIDQLIALKNKKVVLEVEKYGIAGNFIDYSVQLLRLK